MGTGVAVGCGIVIGEGGNVGAFVGADCAGRGVGIGVWDGVLVGVGITDSQAKTNNNNPTMTMVLALVICLMPPLLDHPITTGDYSDRMWPLSRPD